jgi:hypothetical protein
VELDQGLRLTLEQDPRFQVSDGRGAR